MDRTLSSEAARTGARQKLTDGIVLAAMGLVAVAISFAVNVHFGLPMSRAAIAGVLIFALLVGAHFLIVPHAAKAEDIAEFEDEELWRALKEQRGTAPDAKRIAMATRVKHVGPTSETQLIPQTSAPQAQEARPAVRRKPRILSKNSSADHSQAAENAEPATGVSASTDLPVPETYWSYRPSSEALASSVRAEAASPTPPPAPVHATELPGAHQDPVLNLPETEDDPAQAQGRIADGTTQQPSESDVELVQSMIKDLAHRVNARDVLEKPAPLVEPYFDAPVAVADRASPLPHQDQTNTPDPFALKPPELPSQPVQVVPTSPATPQIIAQSAAPEPRSEPASAPELSEQPLTPSSPATVDLVTASVDALRTTADVMREADAAAPDDAPQMDQPVRPVMHPEAAHVAEAIYTALNAGHVGVLLEPIVTLNDLRPDHYEVRLQVTGSIGADIEGASVERDLQATGVLADVDLERFMRALSVGELLRERGKAGSLLTRIYRESLLDRDFCFAVATSGVANEVLAQHMVLTLTQDTVRALTASEWQTLSEFRELGYRFAISHVQNLDMDFTQLMAAGFVFVKLSADAFLSGALDVEGGLTSKDLSRYLVQSGLAIIVDGVVTKGDAAEALALGAGLGQGAITGGPRLMKAEAVANDDHAVA